jgi:Ca2+-binding RTX toxin-like protein
VNGNGENDTISGGFGDDVLMGDSGNDTIYGNTGVDQLFGGAGNDSLFALAGADASLPGADVVHGETGNDSIHTRDNEPDLVDCGPGKDSARLDFVDVIFDATPANPKGSCETVTRAAPKKGEDAAENKRESPPEDARQG